MKIIDNNGRLFGKISIIDVAVVLLVAVLAVALNHKAQLPQTSTNTENTPITFQLWVRNQRPEILDAIHVNDGLYDPDRSTGGSLGQIREIQVSDGTQQGEMSDGTVAQLPCEGRVDLLITVDGSGLVENGSFILNRVYELGVNASRTMNTKYATFTATVVDIRQG